MKDDVCVYCILCLSTGRRYVGSTKRGRFRWGGHKELLRAGRHHSRHLQRAWNKYGGEVNFKFFVLRTFLEFDEKRLLVCEQFYMDKFKSYETGFNTSKTAGRSDCPKEILRAAHLKIAHKHRANAKGQWSNPEMRAKMILGMQAAGERNKGKKRPEQSKAMKLRLQDPVIKARYLEARRSVKQSPESKARQAAKIRALWADPVWSEKVGEIRKTQWTAELRVKQSKIFIEKWKDPIAKDNLKKALAIRFSDPKERKKCGKGSLMRTPEGKQRVVDVNRLLWKNSEWREYMIERQKAGRLLAKRSKI